MTTVDSPRRTMRQARSIWSRPLGVLIAVAGLCFGTAAAVAQQQPNVHYRFDGSTPPGAIGSWQLQRGGPLPGYFQPVEIKAPPGAKISLAVNGRFEEPVPAPVISGLLIGPVYRLRVTNIPLQEGREVYPTIEVIDRLYPPCGQEARFPICIELTKEELDLALDGRMVTRVIYLEDPDAALPQALKPCEQPYFDAGPGANPLFVADTLGRPVAILRMGARAPLDTAAPEASFLGGCPPVLKFSLKSAQPSPPSEIPREARRHKPLIQPATIDAVERTQ